MSGLCRKDQKYLLPINREVHQVKEKFRVRFAAEGKSAELELCMFCDKLNDGRKPALCKHYAEDYADNVCAGFRKAKDTAARLKEALGTGGIA